MGKRRLHRPKRFIKLQLAAGWFANDAQGARSSYNRKPISKICGKNDLGNSTMNEKELVGITLGSCTLERVLGKGGMAIVYLAQQARPIRTVAVKVLLPAATGSDPDQQRIFLERFRREADTAAKLEHKNILPVFEYEEATIKGQRLAYLVMPYIRGGTLRQRIDEYTHTGQRFDLPTVASYISQIADALNYAHSLGVIHR